VSRKLAGGPPSGRAKALSFRLPTSLDQGIRECADALGIDVSDWIRSALTDAVREQRSPTREIAGWQCAHVSIIGTRLLPPWCEHGCEMKPVYRSIA